MDVTAAAFDECGLEIVVFSLAWFASSRMLRERFVTSCLHTRSWNERRDAIRCQSTNLESFTAVVKSFSIVL
jgi:hypothetical protein